MSDIIAAAIHGFLESHLQKKNSSRHFFRLDGFDVDTYKSLLSIFQADDNVLANHPLEIRTTTKIQGHETFELEINKSATWYRNHVPAGHALILIFNGRTSDIQSLKRLYRITETLLATEGLNFLIKASFQQYQLSGKQPDLLRKFIGKLRNKLFEPQLRDLTDFLSAVDSSLASNTVSTFEEGIAQSLPYLGLFRCQELVKVIETSKSERLLKDLYRTAQLGGEVLEERQRIDFLNRLEKEVFMDDTRFGGMNSKQKRYALQKFLTEIVSDRVELLKILNIDWEEVKEVLYRKTRQSKAQKLPELSKAIAHVLDQREILVDDLPDYAQDVIQDLNSKREPNEPEIDQFIADYQDIIGKPLSNKLRRVVTSKSQSCSDFIAGLTNLGIDLLHPRQEELEPGITLVVKFADYKLDKVEQKEAEALAAFHALYGGIEAVIPSISWDLSTLWQLVESNKNWQAEEEEDGEREKVLKAELPFVVAIQDIEGDDIKRAELIWKYQSESPTATTLENLIAEHGRLDEQGKVPIPLYNTCVDISEISDIDLHRPRNSIGIWYRNSCNLRHEVHQQLQPHARQQVLTVVDQALSDLEDAWGTFVSSAYKRGILSADIEGFCRTYEKTLSTCTEQLQTGREALYGFRLLTQAWIVGPQVFGEWAVAPLLHPLKLHWWRERTRRLNQFLEELLSPHKQAVIVDVKRFRRELVPTYSSSGYPHVLSLPGKDGQPEFYLASDEADGYELYRRTKAGTVTYGVDSGSISESEAKTSAQAAAEHLARVLQDYIETYPFVRDGLEIYLMQCRNSSLPGMLIEQLHKIARKRSWQLNVSVIVHTTDRGAPLFHRVSEWLREHEDLVERHEDSFFPNITFRVVECAYEELFNQVGDTDIIILSDVLAERGQRIEAEMLQTQLSSTSLQNCLPVYLTRQAPLEKGEYSRTILLNPLAQPEMVRQFYNIQWAAKERKKVLLGKTAQFQQVISLQDWANELEELHSRFNWVICYDTAVDRFLLEDTFPDAVQVIRFSQGLGIKQQHNLTVSSNYRAQDIVTRRLQGRLQSLLPSTPDAFRRDVARCLVEEAKQVSGDIILRAAGPGTYLNELIGLVTAKYLTEARYIEQHPDALTTWIYLDDFSHWFNRSRQPDLLFIGLLPNQSDEIPIQIQVLETKCVGRDSFDAEASSAQDQTIQGVNRLAQIWRPGKHHLDADYWYEQLYRSIVSNLVVDYRHTHIWDQFQTKQPSGQFSLDLTGHSWIFCHNGDAGIDDGNINETGEFDTRAPDVPECNLKYHHYGRRGLRRALRKLIEKSNIDVPADIWSPFHDEVVEEDFDNPPPPPSPVTPVTTGTTATATQTEPAFDLKPTDSVLSKAEVSHNQPEANENSESTFLSVFLGNTRRGKTPCYWEAAKQPNGFFLILGASGSGKTETLKVIASEIHHFGIPSVIFDFHGDVILDGAKDYMLSHGPASTHGINPMELDSIDPADGGVYAQVNILLSMLKACIPSLGHRQWRIIKNTLNNAYEEAGISDRDINTWTRQPPNFGNVLSMLESQVDDDSISSSQRNIISSAYDAVSRVFEHPIFDKEQLISMDDLLSASHHLNLAHLEEDIRFVVTDTLLRKIARALKSKGNIPVQPQNDYERFRLFVIIDEAKILSLGGKNRDASGAVLNTLATEYRKFGLGMILASQMSDHFSNETKSQIATRLVLKPFDFAEAKKNSQDVNLEPEELMSLRGRGDGHLKMSSDSRATRIQIIPLVQRIQ